MACPVLLQSQKSRSGAGSGQSEAVFNTKNAAFISGQILSENHPNWIRNSAPGEFDHLAWCVWSGLDASPADIAVGRQVSDRVFLPGQFPKKTWHCLVLEGLFFVANPFPVLSYCFCIDGADSTAPLGDTEIHRDRKDMKNPNQQKWGNYCKFSMQRGKLVADLISSCLDLTRASVLDLGAGTGGCSMAFALAGANVTAVEPDKEKTTELLKRADAFGCPVRILALPAENLCEANDSYDVILLHDVLEHLQNPVHVLKKCADYLREKGYLYLATPNKMAVCNWLCDPHFSLPAVALLSRRGVKTVLTDWIKWQPPDRCDFPQLFSAKKLTHILQQSGLTWEFVNRKIFELALNNPQGLWNRPWHLRLIETLQSGGMVRYINHLISDKKDWKNSYLNPTFFILAQKVSLTNRVD